MLNKIKKIIPKSVFKKIQPIYHYTLALLGAILYNFPSRKITVIGITGTKGKTSTTEITASIFRAAGFKVASSSTLKFMIGNKEQKNLFKMTMPGRFFIQKFLRDAVDQKCNVAVIEMSSEGAKQFRHKFIQLDALIFTNLSPEHIESHGSYEKYVEAKLNIARLLTTSNKPNPSIFANKDDKESSKFLALKIKNKVVYSKDDVFNIKTDAHGSSFQLNKEVIHTSLPGIFNVYNMAGAIACAKHFGIKDSDIKKGLESIEMIRGRAENIKSGQDFEVVVDYAHTKESLEAIYSAHDNHTRICILGNTGGGRDVWKRGEMAKVAENYCDQIILTNEDPYDEDPIKIIEDMRIAITKKPVDVILNRREAIREAFIKAKDLKQKNPEQKLVVLITGKGTDPYIMGPNGTKEEWDDATVAREELNKLLNI